MKHRDFLKLGILCAAVFLFVSLLMACTKNSGEKRVRLNEVAHSIFYAPQYVAQELGYFEEQGIEVEVTTGFGADKTMTAVISGEADIGFMGPEATIYLYNEGTSDKVINFAQLTQRAGNFLVSREPIDNFTWDQIKGKEVIGGRAGGMPQMVFEYVLKKNGIDPKTDLKLLQNIDFANTSGAFVGGTGQFTVEFEPAASLIEQQKAGYVVASLGVDSGYVPYTCYCAKESYIKQNKDTILAFTRAIEKGQEYVETHSAEEIAKVIAPQFKDTDNELLVKIIKRYQEQDTYKTDTVLEKESFDLLQNILEEAGELEKRVPYEQIVTTEFSNQ